MCELCKLFLKMCKVYGNKDIHLCIMAVSHKLIEKLKLITLMNLRIMENELMEDSPGRAPSRSKSPDDKQLLGSIIDKYLLYLAMAERWSIFPIKQGSRNKTKVRIAEDKKFPTRNPRHHL